jgi:hypothetical protein
MPVWYAAYGSNLSRERFLTYVRGGRPAGAARTYPGARDPSLPSAEVAFTMPGRMFFGWESPTWGGGIAFYDSTSEGSVLARAYRLTEQQFADVAAQEMHREPGEDLDLGQVLEHARHEVGPGRYETLHLVGELDGDPVLTFTTRDPSSLPLNAPVAAYLRTVAVGLAHTHELDEQAVADYLLSCRGTTPVWSRNVVVDLLSPLRRG